MLAPAADPSNVSIPTSPPRNPLDSAYPTGWTGSDHSGGHHHVDAPTYRLVESPTSPVAAILAQARAEMAARAERAARGETTPPAPPPAVALPPAPAPVPPPPPAVMPPLVELSIPTLLDSDTADVKWWKGTTARVQARLIGATHRYAEQRVKDPVAVAAYDLSGTGESPLACYLVLTGTAGRPDLAEQFLAAAVAEYQKKRSAADTALGHLIPGKLKDAASPPPSPEPAATSVSTTPTASPSARPQQQQTSGQPMTRLKWCIVPQNEIDAFAIPLKGVMMLWERYEADTAKVKGEVPDHQFVAEWQRRWRVGEVIAFPERVFSIISARSQDEKNGIEKSYRLSPPEHLRPAIKARRKELWEQAQQRRTDEKKTRKVERKAKKVKGKTISRSHAKLLRLNEFVDGAMGRDVKGVALEVWLYLFRHEWDGEVEVADSTMATALRRSETSIKSARKLLKGLGMLERSELGVQGVSGSKYELRHLPEAKK